MDQFEYVMVLVSIVVGLGVAHMLIGIGGVIDRLTGLGERMELSIAHGSWMGMIFSWLLLFWWWEFRFSELQPEWTVGLYFFLVSYSVMLFLLAVVLVPRNWDGVTSLDEFFVRRRVWFYSFLFLATSLDVIDALMKGGWGYVLEQGPWVWGFWLATVPVCVHGARSKTVAHHAVMGVSFFALQVFVGFEAMALLGL